MPSINRRNFFTDVFSSILALFCAPLARTTFASRKPQAAQQAEDHSPAYKEGMRELMGGNYENAAELFQQAAADKPDDMLAFHYFGLSLFKLKIGRAHV